MYIIILIYIFFYFILFYLIFLFFQTIEHLKVEHSEHVIKYYNYNFIFLT